MTGPVLQPRDFSLMALISEHGVVTPEAIAYHFWKDAKRTTHYRRLKQLEVEGYIKPAIGDSNRRLGYALARRGRDALEASGHETRVATRTSFRTSYDHDRLLVNIRKVFCSSPLISEYTPELVLRAQLAERNGREVKGKARWKIPDAMMRLKVGERSLMIALELEMATKSKARYDIALRNLATADEIDSTFFVCATPKIESTLSEHLARIKRSDYAVMTSRKRRGFYFARLDEVLAKQLDAPFIGDGKTFTLRELEARK